MGRGVLPCGAYVTMDHEYILVFCKGLSGMFKSTFGRDLRRRGVTYGLVLYWSFLGYVRILEF